MVGYCGSGRPFEKKSQNLSVLNKNSKEDGVTKVCAGRRNVVRGNTEKMIY